MRTQDSATVVGGGLIGMLSALELAQAGRRVLLLDRQSTGRESTWAGGGILSPLYPWRYPEPVTLLARESQREYEAFCAEMAGVTGIDPEWTRSGLMMLDGGEEPLAAAWAERYGYRVERVAGKSVEPALGPDVTALWMPDIAQARNPRLAKALRARLPQLGVEVREGWRVTGFSSSNGAVTGIETDHGPIAAQTVVVAAGAWSGDLLRGLPFPPRVAPVKGQMVLFRAEPGVVSRMVLSGGRYVIPRRDGRVLTGSTLEPEAGFEKETTEQALNELRRAAVELIPALANYPVETQWAGLRPGSPDGVPYIGEHPALTGLFVNAGHFRNGVVLGLASARLLADLVLGRPPRLDPTPYALATPRGA